MEPGECLTGIKSVLGGKMKKYSVRRPGCTSWVDTDSMRIAEHELMLANKICCPGHVIIDNSINEVVTYE